MAEIYYRELASYIGQLSDDNGRKTPSNFLSMNISDVDTKINKIAGTISIDDLELAIKEGLCEAVDFLTQQNDPNFYLGMDVQPGHVSAGLLTERPEARNRVLNTLIEKKRVLISGPSGSGKSGLMWETVWANRHTVRWFRISGTASESDVINILRLADTYKATEVMPVGFIIDDVGRKRNRLWNSISEEICTKPNIFLLGSLREEDIFLIEKRDPSIEIRISPDAELAERIWKELTQRGQSSSPGWREAWNNSNGLLLEYVHILTQGRRMKDLLSDQVNRRLKEKRYDELDILRVVSLAGSAGATIDITKLGDVLEIHPYAISTALQRLLDEHLIHKYGSSNKLGAIHQLRALTLSKITHQIPPPFLNDTIKSIFSCIGSDGIESFVSRMLETNPECHSALIDGAVNRSIKDKNLNVVISIIRGLDIGSINETISKWIPLCRGLGLPDTQATLAASFAFTKKPILVEKLKLHYQAANLLNEIDHIEYRTDFIMHLDSVFGEIIENSDIDTIVDLLSVCIELDLPKYFYEIINAISPNLMKIPLIQVAKLLESVRCISSEIAINWVNNIGQSKLLARVEKELPWSSKASLNLEHDGLSVSSNIFHISDRLQNNIHDDVVNHCKILLALAPSASTVISKALSADGKLYGLNDNVTIQKRINRENLFPDSIPTRNKRWLSAIAQKISPVSLSEYLSTSVELIDSLLKPLEKGINCLLQNKNLSQFCLNKLGEIYESSEKLIKPPSPDVISGESSALGVCELQSILNYCTADLLRDFYKLPDAHVAAYSKASDTLSQIESVISSENWFLISDTVPESLLNLKGFIENLLLIIGECGQRDINIRQIAKDVLKKTNKNNLIHSLTLQLKSDFEKERLALAHRLELSLNNMELNAELIIKPSHNFTGSWPYSQIISIVEFDNISEWYLSQEPIASEFRSICGEGTELSIIPSVGGQYLLEESISGVSLLYPMSKVDTNILDELGLIPKESDAEDKFHMISQYLFEISSIKSFNCATEERAEIEMEIMKGSCKKLDNLKGELQELLKDNMGSQIINNINYLQSTGADFAVNMWKALHGNEVHPDIELLKETKLKLYELAS
jgi:hypothetical protein